MRRLASRSGRCCRLWLHAPAVCCVFIHACTSFGFSHWLLIDGLFYFGFPFPSTVNSDRAVTLCLIFDLVCTVSCVCVSSPSQWCVHADTSKPPRTDTVPGFVTRICLFIPLPSSQLSLTLLTPTSPSLTHSQIHTHTLSTAGVIRNPTRDQFSHIPSCSSRPCLLGLTLLTTPRALGDSGLSGQRSGGWGGRSSSSTQIEST